MLRLEDTAPHAVTLSPVPLVPEHFQEPPPRAEVFEHLRGGVGGMVVHDDDLKGEWLGLQIADDVLEGPRQAGGLVVGRADDGYGRLFFVLLHAAATWEAPPVYHTGWWHGMAAGRIDALGGRH